MNIELISFPICPFVQRAVISLREKGVDHSVKLIDLRNKPDWFMKLSPRGKVPLLLADGQAISESQAIVEFLDETHNQPPLAPPDALGRARDRAWFSLSTEELFMPMHKALTSKDADGFAQATGRMEVALGIIESALADRDWLSGDGSHFGLADVAMAPFFYRVQHLAPAWSLPDSMPRVKAWSQRMLARPSVQGSVPAEYDATMAKVTAGNFVSSQAAV